MELEDFEAFLISKDIDTVKLGLIMVSELKLEEYNLEQLIRFNSKFNSYYTLKAPLNNKIKGLFNRIRAKVDKNVFKYSNKQVEDMYVLIYRQNERDAKIN